MESKKQRGKTLGLFWLRAVCFLLLAVLVLQYAAYVLTPKYDYGICAMQNLYFQEENTVDVLVLGTSLAYAGINTNVLWREQGIAAYDLCSAEQPFWISYYYLLEALKTQTPSLILLDAKPAVYDRDFSKEGRTILSTAGIQSPGSRLNAIRACVGDEEKVLDFALMFPKIHQRYAELTVQDFVYPADNGGRGRNWKGFIEQKDTEHHQRPNLVWVSTKRSINEREEEYVRRIIGLAKERGIPIRIIGIPNPDYAIDHMYFNALAAIAAECDVPFSNYNDPGLRFGLRYSTDFSDWQHLNAKGSVTFTRQLGKDLCEQYPLPDRRGDPRYGSYEACAADWFAAYPEYAKEGT